MFKPHKFENRPKGLGNLPLRCAWQYINNYMFLDKQHHIHRQRLYRISRARSTYQAQISDVPPSSPVSITKNSKISKISFYISANKIKWHNLVTIVLRIYL